MAALLALIPTKDWFIGVAFAIAVVLGWHYYDKYESAVEYRTKVEAESKVALETANKTIADLTTAYNAGLKANEAIYENELQNAAVQHTADTERLRVQAAARGADPVLQGASGTAAEAAAWAGLLGRVEGISGRLADALRQDDAAAAECWRDRDSLSGK